jgi:hypothetical protein
MPRLRAGQDGGGGPVSGRLSAKLLRFHYEDWADESETMPSHWQGSIWEWRHIRAHRRYLDAVHAWRKTHGVSWDEWQAMKGRSTI